MIPQPKENALQSLVKSLDKQELGVLKTYLTAFSGRKEGGTITLKLLDLLLSTKEILSDDDCSKTLYGKPKDNRFEKLKSRLKSKVLDSLINDINIDRYNDWEDIDLIAIKVRKRLTEYFILNFSRPSEPTLRQLLDEILLTSKKYEIYSVLIEALKQKKYNDESKKGEKYFDKLNKEIDHYNECLEGTRLANDLYYKISLKQNFSTTIEKEKFIHFLINSIEILKEKNKKISSPYVEYYLLNIEANYYIFLEDYSKAIRKCQLLEVLIKSNVSVYRKQRIGSNLFRLNQCEIYLGNYKKSIEYAKSSQKYFPANSVNYLNSKEVEFYSLFYNCDLLNSIEVSSFLTNGINDFAGKFRISKYSYFHANVLFVQGKFHETLKTLRENNSISEDKTGWDLGLRVLIILSYVELDKLDLVENALDALRKRHERSEDRDKPIRARDKIIYRILNTLVANSYNFENTMIDEAENIRLLKSTDKEYRWEHFSHELVKFHEWMDKKAMNGKSRLSLVAG